MNPRNITSFVLILALAALWSPNSSAQSVPSLINYQGKLTDAAGNPMPNGTYGVVFCIWNKKSAADAGNTLIWGQEYSVAVQNGVFNVILGAPGGTPVTNAAVTDLSFAFGEAERYIGVTVARGTNGLLISSASEIIPRQQVLSAPYAVQASVALNVLNSPIPRGVIVMWSGTVATIPPGWALCDGQNGAPDLRDRFVVGARQDALGIAKTSVSGSLEVSGGEAAHTLTHAEMPVHGHRISTFTEGAIRQFGPGVSRTGFADNSTESVNAAVRASEEGGGAPHNNLPPFYALAFIMKQ